MADMSLTEITERAAQRHGLSTPAPAGASRPDVRAADAVRRVIDVTLALGGLIFLMPLLLVISVMIKLQDRGPVFFAQPRVGRGGAIFHCFKFRTMVCDAQARLDQLLATDPAARTEWQRDHKLKADPRITALGGFLRRSSIDEIPQLLNVLRGDMSIVGPRPIVRAEISRYAGRFRLYCTVKPGLTGLWQVSGRNNTTYRRRVAMDSLYIRRRTVLMDLKIILATIPAVLQSRGSY